MINADDYYGPQTFGLAAAELDRLRPGRAANIAFELGKTVPPRGAVTRAVVQIESDHFTGLVETEGCERLDDGSLVAGGVTVAEDTPVSMNFWCFDPSILGDLQRLWDAFLAAHADDAKAEAQLPDDGERPDRRRRPRGGRGQLAGNLDRDHQPGGSRAGPRRVGVPVAMLRVGFG